MVEDDADTAFVSAALDESIAPLDTGETAEEVSLAATETVLADETVETGFVGVAGGETVEIGFVGVAGDETIETGFSGVVSCETVEAVVGCVGRFEILFLRSSIICLITSSMLGEAEGGVERVTGVDPSLS